MYINRALLLIMGVAFIFYPSIEGWFQNGNSAWLRPFQVWLLIVLAAWWNQHSRGPDEL